MDLADAPALPNGHSGYRHVLGYLRDRLIHGQIGPGDRLPPERDLALQLGVSRPAVREALRALEMVGLIETRHGVGSIVRTADAAALGAFFSIHLAQQPHIIEDIVEVRVAIERQAVRLACARALPADIARLGEALDAIIATIGDPERGGAADFRFHEMLVASAGSPALSIVYQTISDLLRRSHVARRQRMARSADFHDYVVEHHRSILDAIVARDADRADALMLSHFSIGAELHRRALSAPA